MVSFQAQVLCSSDTVCNEDLADVVRLGGRQVAIDNVLQRTRKHLPVRVACETGRRVGRQDKDNGPRYVAGRIGTHPGIVALALGWCRGRELFRRRVIGIVRVRRLLAPLHLLVAFEVERFGHRENTLVVGGAQEMDVDASAPAEAGRIRQVH